MMPVQRRQPTYAIARLRLSLALLAAVVAVGTAGFVFIGERTPVDALYLTLVTISTLGMKAQGAPITSGEKIWIMVLIAVGIGLAMIALTTIVGLVVEGHVRRIFGRRQVNRTIASLSNHTIVCGYGRMGSSICEALRQWRKPFVIIDNSDAATTRAEQSEMPYVLGDASDAEVLHDAGIERASALVAVLPTDSDNVFTTLVAREINRGLFIAARAERVESEAHLLRAGANKTICPQIIGARRLANILTRPGVVDFIDFATEGIDLEAEQYHLKPDNKLVGVSLREANLPRRVGVLVIALRRASGQIIFNPAADTVLQEDDVMVLTGQPGSMAKLQTYHP